MSLPPPPTPDLVGLPAEIKRKIVSKLEPVDTVCLAITHSHLYNYIQHNVDDPSLITMVEPPSKEDLSLDGNDPFEILMRRLVLYLPRNAIFRLLENRPLRPSLWASWLYFDWNPFDLEIYRRVRRRYMIERVWDDDVEKMDKLARAEKEWERYKKEQNKLYWAERSIVIQRIKAMDTRKVIGDKGMGKEIMRRPLRKGFVSMRGKRPAV